MDAETMLWYEKPAEDFDHALPVGNGRIGAMIFGGAADEVLKLNEDSIWSGGKRNRNNPDAREGLEEVRKLLKEERIPEAEKAAHTQYDNDSSIKFKQPPTLEDQSQKKD